MNMTRNFDNQNSHEIDDDQHFGHLVLTMFGENIGAGFDDLEKFELIELFKKPVLMFIFEGTDKMIADLDQFLSKSPYPYTIVIDKGEDLGFIDEKDYLEASVYISKFPNFIEFIRENNNLITHDLWGLLFGYPLEEVHDFTYNWTEWRIMKDIEFEAKGGKFMTIEELVD